MFDLREEPWLPIRRHSESVAWATIKDITGGLRDDPIVELATPRADFDGAVTEFLIGLLTTAFYPLDIDRWLELWHAPPSPKELHAVLAQLPDAFNLGGDGPRFLQDLDRESLDAQEVAPVQDLLIDGKNDPLFIKPKQVGVVSRAAAAMALITMQTYSPAGGRGYRTSVRGGGPLTTLVDPGGVGRSAHSLWHFLWANVPLHTDLLGADYPNASEMSRIFPWLAPTRTSEGNRYTTLAHAHPLQAFFGMPRRIRLEFSNSAAQCDLTGISDSVSVVGFRTKAYGVGYQALDHPLSPYYQAGQANEWLPVHGRSGGVQWKDWLPLLYRRDGAKLRPASTVAAFAIAGTKADRLRINSFRLRAFGFDMANAKARSWVQSSIPAFAGCDADAVQSLLAVSSQMADATQHVATVLHHRVSDALYPSEDQPKSDALDVRESLWRDTEGPFSELLSELVAVTGEEMDYRLDDARRRFLSVLKDATLAVYDRWVEMDPGHPALAKRAAVARFDLVMLLSGHGKPGKKLLEVLGLEPSVA